MIRAVLRLQEGDQGHLAHRWNLFEVARTRPIRVRTAQTLDQQLIMAGRLSPAMRATRGRGKTRASRPSARCFPGR